MGKSGLVRDSVAKDHLDFAERLLSMFSPADARRRGWEQRIQQARQRLVDTHYYLAVVGEFNAGKSTVINALLEAELFASSSRPTTAAAVWVRHGQRLVVRVGFRDGRTWTSTAEMVSEPARWRKIGRVRDTQQLGAGLTTEEVCERLSELDSLEALRVVTADDTVAPDVLLVEVEYPSPLLASGLVLIDTPGAGSGDHQHGAEHARIASQAVSDADAAVVITEQSKLLPESLTGFLTASLDEGLLARCTFVVTRADQVEPGEFDDLCRAGAERIARLLRLPDPPVAWASPWQVMRGLRGEDLDDDARAWVERFDQTRRWLRRIAEERRPAAVTDTTLRIIQELLSGLDAELAKDLSDLEWKQRELDATAPADMTDFLAGQVSSGIRVLRNAEHAAQLAVSAQTRQAGRRMEEAIREKIEPCGNGKAIRRVLAEDVRSLVDAGLRQLVRRAQAVVKEQLNSQLSEVTSELQEAFATEYAKLERIDPAPGPAGVSQLTVATAGTEGATFATAAAIAAHDSQRDAFAVGGGASMGALIGTMMLPGIGTVVGGFIGALIGGGLTENIVTVRERAVAEASASAGELVETTGERLAEATQQMAEQAQAGLQSQGDWYRSAYDSTIRAMREAHDITQRTLQARHDELAQARREAADRRAMVAAERTRLQSVDHVRATDPFGGSDD
jgi:hypothetical protein